MARHNLFLGKARGKIGDVVLSQLDGKQVARARNRNPKNPKSNKQMYQRSIMASVMQMYSAGKMIFDHSFEGKSVKFGAMRRFMSVNAKKLRADILADLANNTSNARVVHPGAVAPCPYAFRVSEGQYGNGFFSIGENAFYGGNISIDITANPTAKANEALQQGDIYTILFLFVDGAFAGSSSLASPAAQFGFVRCKVKANLPSTVLADTAFEDVFDAEYFNVSRSAVMEETTLDGEVQLNSVIPAGCTPAAFAVIRSAEDSGLRSTADFVCAPGRQWGITSQNILSVWNAEVKSLGDSDLILEGGSLDGGSTTSGGGGGGGGGTVTITGRSTQNAVLKSGDTGSISGNPAAIAQMSDGTTRPVVNNLTDKTVMKHNGTNYSALEYSAAGSQVLVDLAISRTTWDGQSVVTVAQMQDAGF